MTRALLVVSLLCGGCLIVPAKKTTSVAAGQELGKRTFATARSVELVARMNERSVDVHAIRHGECSRPVYAVTEITTERKAKLGGVDDPRAALFGLLLAPVLIPTSALVTGLVLAADSPSTTRQTRPIGTQRFACTERAEYLAVQLTMPSGQIVYGVTDKRGDARVEVPSTEPYTGSLTIAAQGAEPKVIAYALPRPAVTIAREAVRECGARHGLTGRIEVKLAIDKRGLATRLWLSEGDDEVGHCVSQRVTGRRFPEKMWNHTIKMPVTIVPGAASL